MSSISFTLYPIYTIYYLTCYDFLLSINMVFILKRIPTLLASLKTNRAVSVIYSHNKYAYTHIYIYIYYWIHTDTINKDAGRKEYAGRLLYKYILPLTLLQGFERVVQGLHVRRPGDRT